MSIQFSVAAALRHGAVAETNYERLDDPEIVRLIRLVRLEADSGFTAAFPARQGSRVEIELVDGRRFRETLADVVPATEAEIRARFRASAGDALDASRASAIERLIDRLETASSAGELPRLAAAPRNATTSAA
jgi:2-methylcitrate dehydratase PrpD